MVRNSLAPRAELCEPELIHRNARVNLGLELFDALITRADPRTRPNHREAGKQIYIEWKRAADCRSIRMDAAQAVIGERCTSSIWLELHIVLRRTDIPSADDKVIVAGCLKPLYVGIGQTYLGKDRHTFCVNVGVVS